MEQEITSLALPTPTVQPFDLTQFNGPYRPTGDPSAQGPPWGSGLQGMLATGCCSALKYSGHGWGAALKQARELLQADHAGSGTVPSPTTVGDTASSSAASAVPLSGLGLLQQGLTISPTAVSSTQWPKK